MPITIVERQRIRLKADSTVFDAPRNVLTAQQSTVQLRTGSAAQFEVAHFFAGALAAVSNFSFVTCEIKDLGENGEAPLPAATPLAQEIVEAADFDATLADATWADGSKQHFLFAFSDAEMNWTGKKWILIYATTIGGNTPTLLAGTIEFKQDGGPSVTTPDPVAEDAWTKAESDARYVVVGEIGKANSADAVTEDGLWYIDADGKLTVWSEPLGRRVQFQGTVMEADD